MRHATRDMHRATLVMFQSVDCRFKMQGDLPTAVGSHRRCKKVLGQYMEGGAGFDFARCAEANKKSDTGVHDSLIDAVRYSAE